MENYLISRGESHACVVINGQLYVCGHNSYGELGLGDTDNRNLFIKHPDMTYVESVACGHVITFVVNDGKLWVCGNDEFVGFNLEENAVPNVVNSSFTNIRFPGRVEQVSCSTGHVCVIASGILYSTGQGGCGQLGWGGCSDEDRGENTFEPVDFMGMVDYVECGDSVTYIISDGRLYSCGYNGYGQLGLGYTDNVYSFEHVRVPGIVEHVSSGSTHVSIVANGSLYICGVNEVEFTGGMERTVFDRIQGLNNVRDISCGEEVIYAINNNRLYKSEGNLDEFEEVPGTKDIELITGDDYIYMLQGGKLFVEGDNDHGQLGVGNDAEVTSLTYLPGMDSIHLSISTKGVVDTTNTSRESHSEWVLEEEDNEPQLPPGFD